MPLAFAYVLSVASVFLTASGLAPQIPPNLAFTTPEREEFAIDLSTIVKDPDLTFQLVQSKPWATLKKDGHFRATPGFKEIGTQEIAFTVSDGKLSSQGVFILTVTRSARPPEWVAEIIEFNAASRDPFKQSLAGKVKDLDGLTLHYQKVSGPGWLDVTDTGQVIGTPGDADVGKTVLVIVARNDSAEARKTAVIQVAKKNYPPELLKPLELTAKERETTKVLVPTTGSVVDRDADVLTYSAARLPSWVSLTPEGELTLAPLFAQIGKHSFELTAEDQQKGLVVPVTVNVVRNPRPPTWTASLPQKTLLTREPCSDGLAPFAKDLDGLPVTFKKIKGPDWISVGADGRLSGTPSDGDATGATSATLVVSAANDLLATNQAITLQVQKKNYPPELLKPLELTAKERESTKVLVPTTGSVVDRDADVLTYSAANLPSWVSLTPEGELTLAPLFAQIGKHSFELTAEDQEKGLLVPVTVNVVRNPRPPEWVAEIIEFNAASPDPFKQSLAGKVKDLDGLTLHYQKVSGPGWLDVTDTGQLVGTPGNTDIGKSPLVVVAGNDSAEARKTVVIQVTKKNYPPELLKPLELTAKERESTRVLVPTTGSVVDRDGDVLTYSAANLPSWVSLTPEGELTLTPAFAQIGKHSFELTAKDQEKGLAVPVTVNVVRNPRPPEWVAEIIELNAASRDPLKQSLAGKAKDLDGLTLHYQKVSGPGWLDVTDTGQLVGTPGNTDIGKAPLVVVARNDSAEARKTVVIQVTKKNHPPELLKPLNLTIKEGEGYKIPLGKLGIVRDLDGDPLAFSARTPFWVDLSPDGELTLSAFFSQIGKHAFVLQAKDGFQSVDIPFTLTVAANPKPPEWTEKELSFTAPAPSRIPFTASLVDRVRVQHRQWPIQFKKREGPSWIVVSPKGELTGTPTLADVGRATLVVTATTGSVSADKEIELRVTKRNAIPLIARDRLHFVVKERALGKWDLNPMVRDPDGDTLKFALKDKPDWLAVTSNGVLEARPEFKEIGEHRLTLEVSDGVDSVTARLAVAVDRDPRSPVWAKERFELRGKTGEPFSASLADRARDLDALPIRFSKKSGPEWLKVSRSGELSGTPGVGHTGSSQAVFSIANDKESADLEVPIEVLPGNVPP